MDMDILLCILKGTSSKVKSANVWQKNFGPFELTIPVLCGWFPPHLYPYTYPDINTGKPFYYNKVNIVLLYSGILLFLWCSCDVTGHDTPLGD
jgi:hypothetical protein